MQKNFSGKIFLDKLSEVNWNYIYSIECPNQVANCISKEIKEFLDQMCPIKIFQPRKNKPLGLDDNIIEAMHK